MNFHSTDAGKFQLFSMKVFSLVWNPSKCLLSNTRQLVAHPNLQFLARFKTWRTWWLEICPTHSFHAHKLNHWILIRMNDLLSNVNCEILSNICNFAPGRRSWSPQNNAEYWLGLFWRFSIPDPMQNLFALFARPFFTSLPPHKQNYNFQSVSQQSTGRLT